MHSHRLLFCTCPDRDAARRLARLLVGEHLAACVSLLPEVVSVYRWDGQIEEAQEVQLLIKTSAARVDSLIARLQEAHPYEVPEIIAVPITEGLPAYLDWIGANTGEED